MSTSRILLIVLAVLTLGCATAQADVLTTGHNQNFPCPDPSAYNYSYWHKVGHKVVKTPATYVACTSDFSSNVFGIFISTDKHRDHFTYVGHVFSANARPDWTGGRFWAPDLTRIGNKWVVYFAAYDKYIGRFVIGVAWTTNIRGTWQSKVLHISGDHNSTSTQQEYPVGAIDPGEAYDPYNGMRYLVWSVQPTSIWIAPLSSDGLNIVGSQVVNVLQGQAPIDCSPSDCTSCSPSSGCCIEGSSLMFHDGQAVILYSDKSTWDGSYSMRYATNNGHDPLSSFQTYDNFLLKPNSGWYNTGGGQTPVMVDGHLVLYFHGTKLVEDAGHVSNVRLGLSAKFTWEGDTPVLSPIR